MDSHYQCYQFIHFYLFITNYSDYPDSGCVILQLNVTQVYVCVTETERGGCVERTNRQKHTHTSVDLHSIVLLLRLCQTERASALSPI